MFTCPPKQSFFRPSPVGVLFHPWCPDGQAVEGGGGGGVAEKKFAGLYLRNRKV